MAEPERVANLPAECLEIGKLDEQLTSHELATLSLFDGLGSFTWFYKNPGSTVLRKCERGRIMCQQGDAGSSAFYILTTQDVLKLRRKQLAWIEGLIAATPPEKGDEIAPRFLDQTPKQLLTRKAELEAEINSFSARQTVFQQTTDEAARDRILTVGKVKLRVAASADRPKRRNLFQRLSRWLRRPAKTEVAPAFIHVDSNVPLDGKTLEASLQEGEVFGEMSCLNLAPRSATVSVVQECYMLEFMRNVLDKLYGIEQFKKKNDEIYRTRVLDKQVRQLSVFKGLTDAEFNELQTRLELVEFQAGEIIFDEHDESDCLYVVRSGLVKVIKHATALISREEQAQITWGKLAEEILAGEAAVVMPAAKPVAATPPAAKAGPPMPTAKAVPTATTPAGNLWLKLGADVQELLRQLKNKPDDKPVEETQFKIRGELNRIIRGGELHTAFGGKKSQLIAALESPVIADIVRDFADSPKSWSPARVRIFHRALLEFICPRGLPRREAHSVRTLNYLSKGEILGEIGLLTGQPRSATCLAYDQHDRGQDQSSSDLSANPSRVELVKLTRAVWLETSAKFRSNLDAAKNRRVATLRENAPVQSFGIRSLQSQTPEFEKLGLIQGQKLMLIDLEKCTRCGACVEACVDSHDDGRNRLYLDGPRFDKYLIPVTCRNCLDPVCLIGCPVGAIYKGDNGEINIRNHCIACNTCTTQCPYGSIHKSPRGATLENAPQSLIQLEHGVVIKEITEKAVVCDLCSSSNHGPACVYSCPHDAALRVDARQFFGVTEL